MKSTNNQTFNILSDIVNSFLDQGSFTRSDNNEYTIQGKPSNSSVLHWVNIVLTSRNGSAQKMKGQSLNVFLENLAVTGILFFMQLVLFNFLKDSMPVVYKTNLLLAYLRKKICLSDNAFSINDTFEYPDINQTATANLPLRKKGLKAFFSFKWIGMLFTHSIDDIENSGLDSFYFLRFLSVLQKFFSILSCVITPSLSLMHYKASTKKIHEHITGLDRISIYTLTGTDSNFYIHLVFVLFIVILFHWILITEFNLFVSQKLDFVKLIQRNHSFLKKECDLSFDYTTLNRLNIDTDKTLRNSYLEQMHSAQSTVLIHDFSLCDYHKIINLLNNVLSTNNQKDQINMWYIPKEINVLKLFQKKNKDSLHKLEELELFYILNKFYNEYEKEVNLYFQENCKISKSSKNISAMLRYEQKWLKFKKTSKLFKLERKFPCWDISISKEKSKFVVLGFKINFLKIKIDLALTKIVNQLLIDTQITNYLQNMIAWKKYRKTIEAKYQSFEISDETQNIKNIVVKFDNVYLGDFFCQLLLSSSINNTKSLERNINSDNIIWSNLNFHNTSLIFLSHCLVNVIQTVIIIGWMVPVAVLGVIFQVPSLTKKIPLFRQTYNFSKFISSIMNHLIPIMTLILLTDIVPEIFRWLIKFKYYLTFSKLELNLQKWFYLFSFVQIFVVVTISSSISLILEQIVTNPTKIPSILASNFPQCSNFFVSFIMVRGLAYSISNLLQWSRLFKWLCDNKIFISTKKRTPRKQCETLSNTLMYKWGSIYPIFTLLATISLIYSIIQPLILPAVTVSLGLVLISFKFTIKYQVNSRNNIWETMGKFYTVALFQLYSGIYCLEGFMLGIFIRSNKYTLATVMFVLLVSSVVAHCHISKKYKCLIDCLPLSEYESSFGSNFGELDCQSELRNNFFQCPGEFNWKTMNNAINIIPFADPEKMKSVIWIPRDAFGISDNEIERVKISFGNKCHISNVHSSIDSTGTVNIF